MKIIFLLLIFWAGVSAWISVLHASWLEVVLDVVASIWFGALILEKK